MKKQSIVIFEDWIRYSRCLTDGEFRQLINLILDYYKGIEPTGLKGNLALVWNDIIDDLNGNLNKLKAKREVVANNRKKKTNTNANTNANTNVSTNTNTNTNTTGMVDGRWEMEDGEMEDREMGDGDRRKQIELFDTLFSDI
jgi:hypothetical protein